MSRTVHFLVVFALIYGFGLVALPTQAYEYENAVPLAITAAVGPVAIERVAISLNGHDVVIATELRNASSTSQPVAFYATTSLFSQSGIGEEYLDKSFSDLAVLVNGKSRRVTTARRAFFMGQDITAMLVKAGLSPLPDVDANWKKISRLPRVLGVKPDRWQGLVVHGWADLMLPQQSALHQIRYRSMPQFSLEELASARFDAMVSQHCGDSGQIKERLKRVNAEQAYALLERHDFAVPFASSQPFKLDVAQPSSAALRPQPVVTLVCGISNPTSAKDINGLIDSGAQSASILVISIAESEARIPAPSGSARDN